MISRWWNRLPLAARHLSDAEVQRLADDDDDDAYEGAAERWGRALGHAARCARCRTRLHHARALGAMLAAVEPPPGDLLARILERRDAPAEAALPLPVACTRRSPWRTPARAAAAAVLLLASADVARRGMEDGVPRRAGEAPPVAPGTGGAAPGARRPVAQAAIVPARSLSKAQELARETAWALLSRKPVPEAGDSAPGGEGARPAKVKLASASGSRAEIRPAPSAPDSAPAPFLRLPAMIREVEREVARHPSARSSWRELALASFPVPHDRAAAQPSVKAVELHLSPSLLSATVYERWLKTGIVSREQARRPCARLTSAGAGEAPTLALPDASPAESVGVGRASPCTVGRLTRPAAPELGRDPGTRPPPP